MLPMMTLTGFADEISRDLEEQLDVLASEEMSHIEVRKVNGKEIIDHSDEELAYVKDRLQARGFRVSSIGSPIGKYKIRDDFSPHLQRFQRALKVAEVLQAPNIRIFSFFIPDGENPAEHRDEVLNRMKQLCRLAEQAGITLLHENEKHIYGDTGERCRNILEACGSPRLRSAFDPANFVQCGVDPMKDAYPLLKEHIGYIHIKDALKENKQVVPAGDGDGGLRELIAELKRREYQGFLSVEPHLKKYMQDRTAPECFVIAVRSLKKLLSEAGVRWN
jgi:sugar phosphate isomerase/epimerase